MKQHPSLGATIFKITVLTLLILCFGQIWPQLLAPLQATIVNPLTNTITAQHEINSSNPYFRRDFQVCRKHMLNPGQEKARYDSRAQFAQDKNLRDFFRDCRAHLLAHVFNYHLQNSDITEHEILTRYGLYTNPAFLAYITKLPGYVKHITSLHNQAHHCRDCETRVAKHMGFTSKDAVTRFLDDAQQKICFAQAEQARRAQAAQQQQQQNVILEQQALAGNKEWGARTPVSKKYEIRHTTQDLIEKYGISARELTEFEGSQQQHALHARFIDIMNSTADLDSAVKSEMRARSRSKKSNKKRAKQNLQKQSYRSARKKHIAQQSISFAKRDKSFADSHKINSYFVQSCTALIIKSADIGIQSNKKGNTLYASKIADFCYVALDCAQNIALDIAIGTGEGVYQGVKNVGHMVVHPVDTAINIAHGAHTIVACAYSTIIAAGKGEISIDFDRVYDLVIKKDSQATVRGVSRGIAEIVTETILTGKLCGVIAEFIESTQIISRTARAAARAVKVLTKEKPLYVTAEGIEVYLADGAGGAGKAGKHSVAKRANILKSEMDSAAGGTGQAVGAGRTTEELLCPIQSKARSVAIIDRTEDILNYIKEPLNNLIQKSKNIKFIGKEVLDVSHTFSAKHVARKILDMGMTAEEVATECIRLIDQVDQAGLLVNGINNIHTTISGIPFEVRFFVHNNTLMSFNGFVGNSDRMVKNLIKIEGNKIWKAI
jgi:hypothetical protein